MIVGVWPPRHRRCRMGRRNQVPANGSPWDALRSCSPRGNRRSGPRGPRSQRARYPARSIVLAPRRMMTKRGSCLRSPARPRSGVGHGEDEIRRIPSGAHEVGVGFVDFHGPGARRGCILTESLVPQDESIEAYLVWTIEVPDLVEVAPCPTLAVAVEVQEVASGSDNYTLSLHDAAPHERRVQAERGR